MFEFTEKETKKFQKEWSELLSRVDAAEHDLNVWLRNLRVRIEAKHKLEADKVFREFVCEHLPIGNRRPSPFEAKEYLARSYAGEVFKTRDALVAAGGVRAVRRLAEQPRDKMITMMQRARDERFSINTIINKVETEARKARGELPRQYVNPTKDATELAAFVAALDRAGEVPIPPDVREVMERWVKATQKGQGADQLMA